MDNSNIRILIVDDEDDIREGLRDYLDLEGFAVSAVPSAEEALALDLKGFDLLLLDVMMAGMNGFELARRIKADPSLASIPIIFLTARDTEGDMVDGLKVGADDYIPKPFSTKVLLARIDAVMRRCRSHRAPAPIVCDRTALTCLVDGRTVRLPRKEFEIMALMLDYPGRIFSREELLHLVWPENVIVVDRAVDVHITRIRSKIAPYGRCIVSRSGYGYGWQN